MIGTIRKHSTWMWGIIITGTVISFVYWGSYTGGGGSGGRGQVTRGTIAGRAISEQQFVDAYREMELRYFFTSGEWPGNDAERTGFDPSRETYLRILLLRKADDLNIHASLEATAQSADAQLRRLNGGNPVPLTEFVRQKLAPRQMTGGDFERFIRNDLRIQQVLTLAGSCGTLVTPQDARALYEREHREYVTQAIFFHPSNYLSGVTPTPEALGQFFTNQLPRYRIPERLRVSYVKFEATNFLAEAMTDLNKQFTNLTEVLEAEYQKRGGTNFYHDKTADEAKAEILKVDQNVRALFKARAKANAIASVVMESDPVRVENLAAVAQTNGLTVEVTQPFTRTEPPTGLDVGEEFMNAAFSLTDAEPVTGPVMGKDAAYVIAFHSRLPSEVPAYEQVRDRVAADYTLFESSGAARVAGTTVANTLSNAIAAGKSFTVACTEANAQPVTPPPFSLNATNVPQVEHHVNLTQYKQAMFLTPVGQVSQYVPSNDGGGFVLYVQEKLPVDETRLALAMPEVLRNIRQGRQTEALNYWISTETQRDPGFREILTALNKRNQPETSGSTPLN